MKSTLTRMAVIAALLSPAAATAQPYFYVGAADGDFYDEGNWNTAADGTGTFLMGDVLVDDTGNDIGIDLIIDNDSVVANGQVDFGAGSLTIQTGAMLSVTGSGHDIDMNAGSTLSITGGSLVVDDFIFMEGDTTLNGASLTASDDITIEGLTSIIDSVIESTGDDIEFQDTATITSITGSEFRATSLGSDGSFNQSVIFQISLTASDSLFQGGQLGFDGLFDADLTVTDSTFDFTGDINNVFNSGDPAIHRIILQGDSQLSADQIEDGILLAIQDSSEATFIDDADDDDDDMLPDTWIITNALVRLDSRDASLTFLNPSEIDVRNRVFNGLVPTTYALAPETFVPSDWNGTDAVTLRVVPEPAASMVVAVLACCLGLGGRRRA